MTLIVSRANYTFTLTPVSLSTWILATIICGVYKHYISRETAERVVRKQEAGYNGPENGFYRPFPPDKWPFRFSVCSARMKIGLSSLAHRGKVRSYKQCLLHNISDAGRSWRDLETDRKSANANIAGDRRACDSVDCIGTRDQFVT